MILGLLALVLLAGPASDSSQRSIKSSVEILGDTSAFKSDSARGSRVYKTESDKRSDGERQSCSGGLPRITDYKINDAMWISSHVKIRQKESQIGCYYFVCYAIKDYYFVWYVIKEQKKIEGMKTTYAK